MTTLELQGQAPDPEQREDLFSLFCERDLLEQDGNGSYRYRVPLIARWIAEKRRLPTAF